MIKLVADRADNCIALSAALIHPMVVWGQCFPAFGMKSMRISCFSNLRDRRSTELSLTRFRTIQLRHNIRLDVWLGSIARISSVLNLL